ncbi:TonB family protein [Proteus hauseri]|uniref:TonB family protein n=1 Tax=Proteus hauseri TaxID=183417 RepID=UPI0032DB87EF
MNKYLKYTLLLLIFPTVLLPFWLPAFLMIILNAIDGVNAQILPSSIIFDERNFLLGLWLGSLIMMIVMLLQSWRSKNGFYLLGATLVVFMTVSVSLTIIPHSELENRRRTVLQDIAAYQWRAYHLSALEKQENINKAIFSKPQKAMEYLNQLNTQRKNLPALNYLAEDLTAATAAKADYLTSEKETTIQKEAIKTLAFYADWLLTQPEIVITQALSSLFTPNDPQLELTGINVLLSAPLMVEAWQTIALTHIVKSQANLDLEKATATLMVADMLESNKSGYHSQSLQTLLKKVVAELPKEQQQAYQILQARVVEERYYRQKMTPPAEITALANQRLMLNYIVNSKYTVSVAMHSMTKKEHPGIVTVESPNEIQNLTEVSYPLINQYIPYADVILSVDVDAQGRVSGLWIQRSSGIESFDYEALKIALPWRFMPTSNGYRQRVTVKFESSRLGLGQYTVEQQPTIEKLARAYARQDTAAISTAENEFKQVQKRAPEKNQAQDTYRSTNEYYSSYQTGYKQQQEKRAVLQTILKELQTLPNGENNHESWNNSLDFLNEKLVMHQDNDDVVRMVARFELQYYNVGTNNLAKEPDIYPQDKKYWQGLLFKARHHFEQAIGLTPNREDVWLGWAITWLDEDPELAAGAFAKAAQLKSTEEIASVLQMLEMRMVMNTLEGVRLDRYQTLRARMDMRYLPTNAKSDVENDYLSNELTQIQLAQRPIPATNPDSKIARIPLNTIDIKESNRVFSIDFSAANIKASSQIVPKVNVPESAPKMGDMILQLDIDAKGVPTVVMIKSGSGNLQIDNAVVDAAYQWRFNATPKGNVTLISVQFMKASS